MNPLLPRSSPVSINILQGKQFHFWKNLALYKLGFVGFNSKDESQKAAKELFDSVDIDEALIEHYLTKGATEIQVNVNNVLLKCYEELSAFNEGKRKKKPLQAVLYTNFESFETSRLAKEIREYLSNYFRFRYFKDRKGEGEWLIVMFFSLGFTTYLVESEQSLARSLIKKEMSDDQIADGLRRIEEASDAIYSLSHSRFGNPSGIAESKARIEHEIFGLNSRILDSLATDNQDGYMTNDARYLLIAVVLKNMELKVLKGDSNTGLQSEYFLARNTDEYDGAQKFDDYLTKKIKGVFTKRSRMEREREVAISRALSSLPPLRIKKL